MMVHKYFVQSDKDPAFEKYNVELTVVIPVHSLDPKKKGNESAVEAVAYAKSSVENFIKKSGWEWDGKDMKVEHVETVSIGEKSFMVSKINERGYDIIPMESKN